MSIDNTYDRRKSLSNSDGRVSLKETNPAMFAIKKQQYRMKLARYIGITPKNGNNVIRNRTCASDCMVQGVLAPDKPVQPVSDKCNVPLPVEKVRLWIVGGVTLGSYLPASGLKQLLPGGVSTSFQIDFCKGNGYANSPKVKFIKKAMILGVFSSSVTSQQPYFMKI